MRSSMLHGSDPPIFSLIFPHLQVSLVAHLRNRASRGPSLTPESFSLSFSPFRYFWRFSDIIISYVVFAVVDDFNWHSVLARSFAIADQLPVVCCF